MKQLQSLNIGDNWLSSVKPKVFASAVSKLERLEVPVSKYHHLIVNNIAINTFEITLTSDSRWQKQV